MNKLALTFFVLSGLLFVDFFRVLFVIVEKDATSTFQEQMASSPLDWDNIHMLLTLFGGIGSLMIGWAFRNEQAEN